MAIQRINPKSADSPLLPYGGTYGPGAEHEAECIVHDFEAIAEKNPPFDKDGDRGPYCKFVFRVKYGDQLVFLHEYQPVGNNSGSRALPWIKALGVSVSDDGDFDDSDVIGKKCLLTVDAPRPDKRDPARMFNGKVQRVIGV